MIDGTRLSRAFRRQMRTWLWVGPLVFALFLLLALFLIPRTYTAAVSVAMQQPSAPNSTLAILTGGGVNRRYQGILKSRDMAQTVERHVQLRQFYGIRTEEDAVTLLTKSIKLDDNAADGLLYINISLPGQPKLSLARYPTQAQVENKVAETANAYALALKEYYLTNDTDTGAVLLRGADKEVRQARADYEDQLEQVMAFSRGLRHVDPRSAPMSSTGGTDSAVAAGGLGSLYSDLAHVEADLRSQQAAQKAQQEGVSRQLENLPQVPAGDPLLTDARSKVTQDQTALAAALKLYGPENPAVIRAQTQLTADQAQLARQVQGVTNKLTTPNSSNEQQIQALNARETVLMKQIAEAERMVANHRDLSGELGRLQTEVSLRLDYLRTSLTEAARIRLENVSALSRMTVIDYALPPKSGSPGALTLGLGSFLPVVFFFLLAVTRDYLRSAQTARRETRGGPSVNGNGSGAIPLEEPAEAAPIARV